MFHVDLYVMTDSKAPQETPKTYWYGLEYKGKTLRGSGDLQATWHEACLAGINAGLARLTQNCEVRILCQDKWLLMQIDSNRVFEWEKTDFKTSRGTPVTNAKGWRRFLVFTRSQKVLTEHLGPDAKALLEEKTGGKMYGD